MSNRNGAEIFFIAMVNLSSVLECTPEPEQHTHASMIDSERKGKLEREVRESEQKKSIIFMCFSFDENISS